MIYCETCNKPFKDNDKVHTKNDKSTCNDCYLATLRVSRILSVANPILEKIGSKEFNKRAYKITTFYLKREIIKWQAQNLKSSKRFFEILNKEK